MKLRCSSSKLIPEKKRKKLNEMLTDDYYNNNILQIQMALNKKRLLPLDYLIRRTKSKIDSGISLQLKKKEDDIILSSYRNDLEKKRIPEELEKLLMKAEKKFLAQSKIYYTLKKKNDMGLAFWHYINERSKKKKQEEFLEKYFDNENNNNINLYSDRIQKLSETMFITNPLLITKEKIDIFFYYLGEFNKYYFDQEKYEHIKKKVFDFLERLKDFLDYAQIKADPNIDAIGKEIKMRNSKFIKEINKRIKAELKSMKIKQRILNQKEITSATKMINETKKSLESINKDKYFFEDPSYFDKNFFVKKKFNFKTRNSNNKNNLNISAPNFSQNIDYCKMNQTNKMNTTSTGFFANEKKGEKKFKLNAKAESCKNRDEIVIKDNNLKFKKIKIKKPKINNKKIISGLNYQNNKIILKANSIKSNESKNILFNKNENNKNSERSSATSSFYNNNKEQKIIRKFLINKKRKKCLNSLKNNNVEDSKNTNLFSSITNNNEIKMAISANQPMIKINKNNLKRKTFNNITINNMFKFNNKNHSDIGIRLKIKKKKTSMASSNSLTFINNRNSNDFSSNDKSKSIPKIELTNLYETIKSKHKINYFELNDINSYFSQKGKKIRSNLKMMEIITQVKKTINNYDIEHKTKKVFQSNLNAKQNERLNQVREINKKIENLDFYYMNNIFDYKSTTLCENNN